MAQPYSGILFSNENESAERCYHMEETWKHYVKTFSRKRPHTVRLHLYEISRTDKFIKRESTLVVSRDGGWGRRREDGE